MAMPKYAYLYAVKIQHITVNSKWQLFFDAKGKSYSIYAGNDGLWIQDEEMNKCKVIYFAGDEEVMAIITEGECEHLVSQGWIHLNKWEIEEVGN